MIRIGGLLTALILTFFITVNIYLSAERKRSLITTGKAVSTLILKKASENLQRSGGTLLALTALSLELKRTVEGSEDLAEMAFIDETGTFVSHSNPEMINGKAPEEFLDTSREAKVLSLNGLQYVIYPLTEDPLKGLKLVVGFHKRGHAARAAKYLALQLFILLAALAIAYFSSSMFIQSQVLKPLDRLRRHSMQLREGDLTHYASVLQHDEIGELTEAFNNMTESIRGIIEKISSVS